MTLQSKGNQACDESSRHTDPDRPVTQQLRRSTLKLGRHSSVPTASRRRRPRRRVGGCSGASQVLYLEVATSKGLAQTSVSHELADVERETVIGQVAVLRGKREVDGLLEHDDVVVVRDIAYRRRWLQVGYGSVRDNERGRVRGDPMYELDSGAVSWHVEVHDEEDAGRVVGLRCCVP